MARRRRDLSRSSRFFRSISCFYEPFLSVFWLSKPVFPGISNPRPLLIPLFDVATFDIATTWFPASHLRPLLNPRGPKTTYDEVFVSICAIYVKSEIYLLLPAGSKIFLVSLRRTVEETSATTFFFAPDPVFSTPMLGSLPPVTTNSTPIIAASPYSHQAANSICPETGNLGFHLLGLSLKADPLSHPKPSNNKGEPNYQFQKPRSVITSPLSSLSDFKYRFLSFVRRLQTEGNILLLLWLYKISLRTLPVDSPRLSDHERLSYTKKGFRPPSPNYLRTLPLESSRITSHVFSRMKKNGIMIPSPRTGGYRCFFRPYFPFPLNVETSLMHICYIRDDLLTPRSLKPRFDLFLLLQTGYKLCVEFLNLHGRRGLHARENPPVMLRSCIYPLRILELNSHPSPILTFNLNQWSNNTFAQTLTKALPRVALLAPARNKSLAPSSTPLSLMTLAIQSSLDSLLEDLLIILDLTCIKKLHSLWFTALKNPLSTNRFYHCISFMLALGNVFSSCILNFGVSSSYLCIWFLF